MRNYKYAAIAALALSVSTIAIPAVQARPMTAQDLATLKRVGAPAISPDGKNMAYTVTTTDLDSNERKTAIYLQSLTLADAQPILIKTSSLANSSHSPVFSSDGKSLYYISNESKSDQIWRYDMASAGDIASPTQISNFSVDVAGFKLSDDNSKIAIWADISTDCQTLDCPKETANKDTALPGPGTGREYDKLFVRHWSSWESGDHYSRLFSYDLSASTLSNGKLVSSEIGDTPSKPFGGGEEIAIAGEKIFYTLRTADRNEPLSTNLDIYSASADGSTVNITAGNLASDTMPTPSPDGKYLAYAAMKRAGYESDKLSLIIKDMKSGAVKNLTENWDRSIGSIAWSADSQSLIISAQDILDHPIYSISVKGGTPKRLTQGGNANNAVPLADGSIIYTKNDINSPDEIFHYSAKSGERQLSDVNGAVLAQIDKVNVQRFDFEGAEGAQIWGQIIKPVNISEKLPVAFLVHGGPQGSFGNSWSYRWNPKVMASQGFVAVTVDFHGSTGYGQKFTDSINQDWGGKPLTDLKLGLAAAGKLDAQADIGNACALGASYGGYMMNWILGQWNDGFKCIVNHAGLFDLRQFSYETEELWFDQWDHGGPWTTRENGEKWNPVNHVTNWKMPTLVIHGEKDFRVPLSQSLAAFTALQQQGVESKLLVFPDENHWINKPQNSIQWHNNVFAWIKKYTDAEAVKTGE